MVGHIEVGHALRAAPATAPILEVPMVEIENLSFWYGTKLALKDVSMSMPKHRVTAYIGPSGCGKTTLLRCLNRMNDLVAGVRIDGNRVGGTESMIRAWTSPLCSKRVGMVFQRSNPFPQSIYENVAYGPRILGLGPSGISRASWSGACAPRPSGTRCKTGCTTARSACPAGSSSACASRARSPSSPTCC